MSLIVENKFIADQVANEFTEYFSTVAENHLTDIYHTGSDFSLHLTK